jgi:probable addiction module antidote protein
MSLKLKKWDTAEFIQSDADGRLLLEEMAREGDAADLARVIEALARARGMSLLAQEIGLSTEALFDLCNPWENKLDEAGLREVANRLIAGRPADAAE